MVSGSLWVASGSFWVASGSPVFSLGFFWVASGSLLGRFWIASGSLLGRPGSLLGRFWVAGDFSLALGFLAFCCSLLLFIVLPCFVLLSSCSLLGLLGLLLRAP